MGTKLKLLNGPFIWHVVCAVLSSFLQWQSHQKFLQKWPFFNAQKSTVTARSRAIDLYRVKDTFLSFRLVPILPVRARRITAKLLFENRQFVNFSLFYVVFYRKILRCFFHGFVHIYSNGDISAGTRRILRYGILRRKLWDGKLWEREFWERKLWESEFWEREFWDGMFWKIVQYSFIYSTKLSHLHE